MYRYRYKSTDRYTDIDRVTMYDPDGSFPSRCNTEMVALDKVI